MWDIGIMPSIKNLKPFKIDDQGSLFSFKTKKTQTFFDCHVALCKLLIFMVI